MAVFHGTAPQVHPWTIASINEDRLLKELRVPHDMKMQMEGLQKSSRFSGPKLQKLATAAIVRFVGDPPPEVGKLQRCTAQKLLRAYPMGLRFSGANMSPLYLCWDLNCGVCTGVCD